MMQRKIAIFSGTIPSTPFIEQLICSIALTHQVQLFGTIKSKTEYKNKNVFIYKIPSSHFVSLLYNIYRSLLLVIKRPKDILILFQEINKLKTFYDKWIKFTKFLPIVLYRPDILHIQWAKDLQSYWFFQSKFKIPIVLSLRGTHIHSTPIVQPYIGQVYRETFQYILGFHAVSKHMKSKAVEFGAKPKNVKVIHSSLSPKLLSQFTLLNKMNKKIKLISIGRFHWIKGYEYALKAVSKLIKKDIEISYTIISTNPIPESFIFKIKDMNLGEIITIKEGMSHEELILSLKQYDLLLLPSLEEGIANVILEAMALGIPVISTNCGGMNEVVIPNKTGWLVPIRDADAIANAIIEVSKTPEIELQRITQNAHNFVKKNFNVKDSIQQFLELYEGVMKTDDR